MRNFLKEFFGFSKSELNGLLVFSMLLVMVAFAPLIYSWFYSPPTYNYSAFAAEVASFRASANDDPIYSYRNKNNYEEAYTPPTKLHLFKFNPNGLSDIKWKELGLRDKQIKVIKNYEAKGGKFYRKEDLQKIYSIHADQYAMLEPYITIPETNFSSKNNLKFTKKAAYVKEIKVVELNTADSAQLESISGIGPAFALRILKYRTRLGGFHHKTQLKEVYGIDSLVYHQLENQITVNPDLIQTLSINTVTFAELKKHPYLSYKQMNAIINYRKQHGPYKTISDLKEIVILDAAVLSKMAPYLNFK